jgi:hypothetical protein
MPKNYPSIFSAKALRMLGLGTACVIGSFMIGVETAGEVQPFTPSEAGSLEQASVLEVEEPKAGDADGSGHISVQDAIEILEIVQGYREATPEHLKADPNGDHRLTIEDALRVLRALALR